MKLAAFHLMPWPHLPANFSEVEDSAWITYPNSNFKPELGTELYNRYLDELAYCEELGFDVVAVNEHHQTAYGLMPSPNLMAMSLVERTKRVKVAILGNAIPAQRPPDARRRGAQHARRHQRRPDHLRTRPRTRRRVPLVLDEPCALAGALHRGARPHDRRLDAAGSVRVGREALQAQVRQPVAAAAAGSAPADLGSDAGVHRDGALGRREGLHPLPDLQPIETVAKSTRQFRDFTREFGYSPSPERVGWSVPIYVGKDDETALREFKPHIEYLYHQLRRRPWQATVSAGYVPRESAKYVMKRREGIGTDQPTAEELLARGEIIVGGPDTVNRLLRESIQKAGIGTLAMMIQSGTMGPELTRASIERLAEKVLPGLKDYLPDLPEDVEAALPVIDPVSRTV